MLTGGGGGRAVDLMRDGSVGVDGGDDGGAAKPGGGEDVEGRGWRVGAGYPVGVDESSLFISMLFTYKHFPGRVSSCFL